MSDKLTGGDAVLAGRWLYNDLQRNAVDTKSALESIEDGAMLNIANEEGITTLMCACAGGHTEIVKAMLQSGRDVGLESKDSHGWTALITAAHRADASTVKALIDAGADVKVSDQMGRDALSYARGSKDADKILVLEETISGIAFRRAATELQQPVSVRKPLRLKP